MFVTSAAASKANAYLGPYAASRQRLKRWRGPGQTKPRNAAARQPVRSRPDPDSHARHLPGEDQETLEKPEQAAEFILPMCAPDWSETGKLFDYPSRKLMNFRAPGKYPLGTPLAARD